MTTVLKTALPMAPYLTSESLQSTKTTCPYSWIFSAPKLTIFEAPKSRESPACQISHFPEWSLFAVTKYLKNIAAKMVADFSDLSDRSRIVCSVGLTSTVCTIAPKP